MEVIKIKMTNLISVDIIILLVKIHYLKNLDIFLKVSQKSLNLWCTRKDLLELQENLKSRNI